MSRFSSQIAQYQSNNRGQVPTTDTAWATFITQYMQASGDVFEDPDGTPYEISDQDDLSSGDTDMDISNYSEASGSDLDHTIYVLHHAHCEGEKASYSSGARNLAFLYQLEGTGVYCGTN